MTETPLILGLGELLWDMLPDGPRLGGAPANFAVMSGRLGNRAVLLSRIGRDALGCDALMELEPLPVDTRLVQTDEAHETGQVTVAFADGQPSYTIREPAAWDFMELSDEWVRLADRADAVCFGSLAQRGKHSRQTLQALVSQTPAHCIRVFDVNLREPWYSSQTVQQSLALATVMKMNDVEVPLVMKLLGLPAPQSLADGGAAPTLEALRAGAERMLTEFDNVTLVAITRGGHGSLLVRRHEWNAHPGMPIKVVDTIGAGDAFTAAMTHCLLRGMSLGGINEAGNRWGGWVASQAGAMPPLPETAG